MDLKEHYERYKNSGGSYRTLAAKLNIKSHAYVQMAINGWGNFNLSEQSRRAVEEKIMNYFTSEQLKVGNKYDDMCAKANIIPFENTIIIMKNVVKTIRQGGLMGIVAKSGTGKTTAIKALALRYPQMEIITAYDGMSKKELLEEISEKIGADPASKSQQNLMKAIKKHLSKTRKVIVIDEANFMSTKSLEQVRHIQDETGAAIVLIGTEKLHEQIVGSHEQVESRIRKPSEKINLFGENEVAMLFEKAGVSLDEKEASAVWKKCQNLREVRYLLDDLIEIYGGDKSKLKELL
ncbi:ATP-binding protein [Campylobacter sp. RM16191]|uniref:ATP-binding protein n=1 Tax=Campylobacter sp. RM16191 TaxID=1705728 RepID=UPI001475645C|nr:ATP-binding protein [Campylobacter sp. RM16191]